MKILRKRNTFKSTIIILLFFNYNASKAQNVTVTQDAKFEQLLNEKKKLNTLTTTSDRYRIQIFNGSNDESKKSLIQFKKDNKEFDATIIFSTPVYKVWVGNFKTRIEAERNLIDIKKKYPNAILIKPNK
jgi:hypothetical protein